MELSEVIRYTLNLILDPLNIEVVEVDITQETMKYPSLEEEMFEEWKTLSIPIELRHSTNIHIYAKMNIEDLSTYTVDFEGRIIFDEKTGRMSIIFWYCDIFQFSQFNKFIFV